MQPLGDAACETLVSTRTARRALVPQCKKAGCAPPRQCDEARARVTWRDAPADWHHDGIAMWLLPHAPRQRGEPQARESLAHTLGFAPETLPITRDAQGRPHFIAPLHHLETGWSHSGEALLLALGEDIELGVDIERLRPRPRAMDLAERFYHPEETAWLRGFDDDDARLLAFVRLWCIKEAVLKAHGQGISFGLHRFHVALDEATPRLATCDPGLGRPDDWRLHEWSPRPDYRAALAWHPRGRREGLR